MISAALGKNFDGAYLTSVEAPASEERVDKDGNLIDKNGKLILDKDGKPIKGSKYTKDNKPTEANNNASNSVNNANNTHSNGNGAPNNKPSAAAPAANAPSAPTPGAGGKKANQ